MVKISRGLYKNGKLDDAARAKLAKAYEKEMKKGEKKLMPRPRSSASSSKAKLVEKKNPTPVKKAAPVVKTATPRSESTPEKVTPEVDLTPKFDEEAVGPRRTEIIDRRKKAMEIVGDENWISLTRHDQNESAKEAMLEKDLISRGIQNFKSGLDEQKSRMARKAQRAAEQKRRDQQALQATFQRYDQEANDEKKHLHVKVQTLKLGRSEQMKAKETRLRQERERRLRRDRNRAERNLAALEAEKKRNQLRKMAQMEEARKTLDQNERYEQIKRNQAEKEAQEDIRRMKEYAAKLDSDEAARKQRLVDIAAKSAAKQQLLMESTKGAREAERLEALRVEKEYQAKLARDDARAQAKKDALKQLNAECMEQNRLLREARQQRKQGDHGNAVGWGERLHADAAAYEQEEVDKVTNRKVKAKEIFQTVQAQMAANEHKRTLAMAEMSEEEVKLNKMKLHKAKFGVSDVKEPVHDPKKPFAWRYNYRRGPI